MQRPTLTNVRIRSTRDALRVFHGVARNVLPLTTRRLDAEERRAIVSGNVYVWEERGSNNELAGLGMERWTDGMGWGPSRVRDDFLFYARKTPDYHELPSGPMTPWSQMVNLYTIVRPSAPCESERLIKQTYSVHVSLPDDRPRGITRKWHLTAYFSQEQLDELEPIDSVPGVGDVPVPDGLFRSARQTKSRRVGSSGGVQPHHEGVITLSHPPAAAGTSSFPVNPDYAVEFPRRPAFDGPDAPASPPAPPPAHAAFGALRAAPPRRASDSPPGSRSHSRGTPTRSPSPYYELSPSASPPARGAGGGLVPLEALQSAAYPRRDPIDEQLLSRFSTQMISGACAPSALHTAHATREYASAL